VAPGFRLFPDDPDIGWAPYIWIVYLVFVFLGPVFAGIGDAPAVWIWSVLAVTAFLPLYRWAYWTAGWRQVLVVAAMCGLGAALAGVNIGANTFFIFAAYFAGRAHPRSFVAALHVGAVATALLLTAVFVEPVVYFWAPGALGVLVVGALGVLETQRSRYGASLRLARAEVEALARIAERDRIARDLHDLLGHSLSVVALKSELAQRLVDKDLERVRVELGDVRDVARQALTEVRTAVRGYKAGSGAGLRHELDNASRSLRAAEIEPDVDGGPEVIADRLDAEHEGVLALALREAVTNVLRHAGASRCRISFVAEGDHYGLDVHDDGRGFGGRFGYGLQSMRERVRSIGGTLDRIEAGGTLLRIRFGSVAAQEEAAQ
jgi:two-component system sensor histidine kinase DesK